MDFNVLLKELTIEDLQGPHKQIAETIGLDNLVVLSKAFGGTPIYIPMQYELVKNLKYRKIVEEFNGDNVQELAVKYKTSYSTVYRIVKDEIAKKKVAPMEGQINLFDC